MAYLAKKNNGNFTIEVNLISFDGAEPKIDIRKWDRRNNKMLKGIALAEDEAEILLSTLTDYFG